MDNLDKFYTVPNIAIKCLDQIGSLFPWPEWNLVVEPSAGNGSFFINIPSDKKIGMDISPDHADIIQQDFFTYTPVHNGKILVVGNPPFGRVCSTAVKFFNHAAEWSSVIAFIVPRTFRRPSVHNRLNGRFHLVFDDDVPLVPCSFYPTMMVKCCFQIWEKKNEYRPIIRLSNHHKDWEFLKMGPKDEKGQPTPPTNADFAIRAYGGKCGEIVQTNLNELRPKSWHFIKSIIDRDILIERFKSLDYTLSLNTARQNSIGKGELVKIYTDIY